jgi:hypothetical protein
MLHLNSKKNQNLAFEILNDTLLSSNDKYFNLMKLNSDILFLLDNFQRYNL